MKDEARLAVKLPADLLAEVHAKARSQGTTVSALVRKFFLAYVSSNWEITGSLDIANPIYNYQENAKQKRKLKEDIKQLHTKFNEMQADEAEEPFYKTKGKRESPVVSRAREDWKSAIEKYNTFSSECKTSKEN